MGDFNVNLLAYGSHKDTENFYEILSSYSFQPLVLQRTRVTSSSATIIDNIFIGQLGIKRNHFPQFALIDLKISKTDPVDKYIPDFTNFNDREFENEMNFIQWDVLLNGKTSDEGINILFAETNRIFNCTAPIKKAKKKN